MSFLGDPLAEVTDIGTGRGVIREEVLLMETNPGLGVTPETAGRMGLEHGKG